MIGLGKVSDLAVILAALTITGITVHDRVIRPAQLRGDGFSAKYIGKKVPISGLEPGATTLLLFVSKTCRFCNESMALYRRLAATRDASHGHFRMLAIVSGTAETETQIQDHFRAQGIALDDARKVSYPAIEVEGTPTLALVGGDGKVVAVWTGMLSPEQESQMTERLLSLCRGCTDKKASGE